VVTTAAPPWQPRRPATSPYAAVDELFAAWSDGHRSQARAVADPGAVATLFALKYPSAGLLQDGCSTPPGGGPSVCTYRYGLTQDLLAVTVTSFREGWGVTGVDLET
jgi:hypothetical protein